MSAELWKRALEILVMLEGLEVADRNQVIATECEGNPTLEECVRELLAEKEAVEQEEVEDGLGHLSLARPGEILGPYQFLKPLGSGGMGEVFLALRLDTPMLRTDAVKVLPAKLLSVPGLARAVREGEVLRNLQGGYFPEYRDHGELPDKRPYLAMEVVDGLPIDVFCTKNGLSLRDRLQLFLKVCEAVSFAHRALVLHRDLKPSNILVTSEGIPKVLDFGIAKALTSEGSAGRTLTVASVAHFSPDYASPEQFEEKALTTASDVYSLGVLLYKLLAGRVPFDFASLMPARERILERLAREQPTPPSTGSAKENNGQARQRAFSPRDLRGDLDTIVLKALRRETGERYQSVDQLADDIQRFLDDRPIAARPETMGYKLQKMLHRHWRSLAVAATILLMILAFTLSTVFQQRKALKEKERAQQSLVLLREVFQGSDPARSLDSEVSARELLDGATEKIQQSDRVDPLIRAELLDTIGGVYLSLSLPQPSLPLMEEVLELRSVQLSPDDPLVISAVQRVGLVYQELGQFAVARGFYQQAIMQFREVLPSADPLLANALNDLGTLELLTGNFPVAERLLSEALDKLVETLPEKSPEVLEVQNNLGALFMRLGRYGEAEEVFRFVLDARLGAYEDLHPEVASMYNNIGWALTMQRRLEEAEDYFRKALEAKRKVLGPEHQSLAVTLNNLSTILLDMNDPQAAADAAREAVDVFAVNLGRDHPNTAYGLHNLARALFLLRELDEAESVAREVVALREAVLSPSHPELALSQSILADILEERGEFGEAERLHLSSLEIRQRAWAGEHPSIANGFEHLGQLLLAQGSI